MVANANGFRVMPSLADPSSVLTHDELLDADFPAILQYIGGIMMSGTANNWSGDTGIGKTWLELAAARAIASGRPFLDHFPTVQAPVLIIDQESHWEPLQDRVRKLNRADPLPSPLPELMFTVPATNLYVNQPEGYFEIDRLLRERQPGVVFFDSWTRFHNANENDAGEMADVNASVRHLVQDHKVTIVTLDHSRKPSLLDKGGPSRHRLRGSIEKSAFVEGALVVERGEDHSLLTIECTKARYINEFPAFKVSLKVSETEARMTYVEGVSAQERTQPHLIVGAIADIQANHGPDSATLAHIAAYLEVSERTVRKYVPDLKGAGLIAERKQVVTAAGGGRPVLCFDVVREAAS